MREIGRRGASLRVLCAGLVSACAVALAPPAPATASATASPAAGSERLASAMAVLDEDIDPRPSNAEVEDRLAAMAERSDGRVDVRPVGDSNRKQPVWGAHVGHGPTRILYVSQQHGDEPLGTPAALELVRTLGEGDTAWHRWMRDRVSVEVVVRANPDGHDQDWRYNYDPDADPEFGERGKGYDINRYHAPDLAPEDNPATEAAHIQRAYAAFAPDLVVDYHMQGRYADDEGREITASVFWPSHPDTPTRAIEDSQRNAVVTERAITRLVPGSNVSQYPGGDYKGIGRNAYGMRGSASVLLELSAMGEKHEQSQIRSAYAAMLAMAQRSADGSVNDVDPGDARDIPPRGDPIPDRHGAPSRPLDRDDLD